MPPKLRSQSINLEEEPEPLDDHQLVRVPRGRSRAKAKPPVVVPPFVVPIPRPPRPPRPRPRPRPARHAAPAASFDNIYNLPDPELPPKLVPYRSNQKDIQSRHWRELNPNVPSYAEWEPVPKWIARRQRPFEYHHVHGPGTWMADLIVLKKTQAPTDAETGMYRRGGNHRAHLLLEQEMKFLELFVAIQCNSRYAYIRKILRRDGPTLDECFNDMQSKHLDVRTLITDMGGGFQNMQAPVQHIYLNMSSPDQRHSGLSIIDRFVRTLRDMLYNVRPAPVTERVCQELVRIYNTTPHNTLTNTMGFLVTPDDVRTTPELELELIRRWSGQNYTKATRDPDFALYPGQIVWVKYEPYRAITKKRNSVEDDPYRVIRRIGKARYRLQNIHTNQTKEAVRSQIVANFS